MTTPGSRIGSIVGSLRQAKGKACMALQMRLGGKDGKGLRRPGPG